MGSKKSSSSTSTNTTNQYDQRSITTIDDRDTNYSSTSNVDLSNRSTTNVNNADAAAINKQNTDFLQGVAGSQSDAVKAIAQMQASGIDTIGGAFTDISKVASNNATTAWTHTIDAGEALLGKVVDATNASSDSARMVAQAAIASYQPSENKTADGFKYAAIAAAAVAALYVMRKG